MTESLVSILNFFSILVTGENEESRLNAVGSMMEYKLIKSLKTEKKELNRLVECNCVG